MAEKSGWMWVSAGLICGLIVTAYFTAYYYGEYTRYEGLYRATLKDLEALTMQVKILIDYGNGTRRWHNNTRVPLGFSLLNATLTVAKVDYSFMEFGGKLYAWVKAINGVGGSPNKFWFWYYWNSTASKWESGPIASNAHILHHGDTVSWVYTQF